MNLASVPRRAIDDSLDIMGLIKIADQIARTALQLALEWKLRIVVLFPIKRLFKSDFWGIHVIGKVFSVVVKARVI